MSALALQTPPRTGADAAYVRVNGVTKVFGTRKRSVTALADVNLRVRRGEFVCVLGASGCGKSTLLSLIAGLDAPTAGSVERPAGHPALMFQESALLPWLTVRRNVELPLRLRRAPSAERRRTADHLLEMVGLLDFADARPHELSGGMRQRAALARALAQDSELLLMDEPFAALDAITRDQLHADLSRIWEETEATVVFVTHNVREAVRLGDRVVLMTTRPGRVGRQWRIDIPRPRELDDPAVASLAHEITTELRRDLNGDRDR
ncbi:MAG: ABC transporter ATP-binding protein [Candidatus Dormibacteraeota bacterium]|nr:ABC transporter ATP-binding protein [Candidatus Dormibacteraeota bacterium]